MRLKKCEGYEAIVQALTFVIDYVTILCYQHEADNELPHPHYHLVIETIVQKKAFRKRMITIFDKEKGNGHMSIKDWDGKDEAFSYLFHEGTEKQILNKGHTPERIAIFREMNNKIQALVKESKSKASYLLEDEVLKNSDLNKTSDDLEIACAILKLSITTNKYHPNDFLLRLMVDRVKFKLQGGDVASEDYVIECIARRALRLN